MKEKYSTFSLFMSIILSIIIMLSLTPIEVYANDVICVRRNGSYNNGFCSSCGNYQEAIKNRDGYYEIGNAGQLYWFADKVNNDIRNFGSANAVLIADITVNTGDLVNYNGTDETTWRAWIPIGKEDREMMGSEYVYTGIFDGKNHTISGLFVSLSSRSKVGFIGYLGPNGTIKNVGLVNSYIHGGSHVGGVCGGIKEGTILNCYNAGTVKGGSSVGGVCGDNVSGTIKNCYNTGEISGYCYVGGVCGGNVSEGILEKCYNTGDISATTMIGGICGLNQGAITTSCYNTGKTEGGSSVGGLCGLNNFGILKNSYNASVSGNSSVISGVCGENYSGTITNCYYDSSIHVGPVIVNDTGTTTSTQGKTTAEFRSGEVAYLLNDTDSIEEMAWFQNLDNGKMTDTYPKFTGGVVYKNIISDTVNTFSNEKIYGIQSAFINSKDELVLIFLDGTQRNLGKVEKLDGVDGIDGKDGITPQLGINDETYEWEISYDNGLTWTSLGIKANGSDGNMGEVDKEAEGGKVGKDEDISSEEANDTTTQMNTNSSKGRDGKDGVDGKDGKDGKDGIDGKDGTDGVGVANATIDANGYLILTMTDGSTINAGLVREESVEDLVHNLEDTTSKDIGSVKTLSIIAIVLSGSSILWQSSKFVIAFLKKKKLL